MARLDACRRIMVLFTYDLKKYYLKAPVLSWGILFPVTIILLLGISGYTYSRMIPVGFTIGILFASTSIVHTSIAFEKMNNSINMLLYLPIRDIEVAVAKLLGGLFYGLIGAGIAALLFNYTSGGLVFINPLFFTASLLLGSTVFSLLTIIIVFSLEPIKAIAVLNLVRFTMMFLGGLLLPRPLIPVEARPIVYVFPSVYVVDLMKYGLYNDYEYVDPYTSLIILTIYLFTLSFIAGRIILRVLKP